MLKKIFLFLPVLLPTLAFAQDASASPSTFNGSITLWAAILIGLVASLITLINANKLGGTIASVLWYVGTGMLIVVIGFLAVVVNWAPEATQKVVHDTLFIIGYILMTIGSVSLYKLNRGIS